MSLDSCFRRWEAWKERILDLAARQTYLLDEWGKVQFFFEVYSWRKNKYNRWEKVRTDEAEKALAFRVQGTAFGMLKYEHKIIEEKGWNETYNWLNSIHDSLVFMPRIKDRDNCLADIQGIMNAPCPILRNEATGAGGTNS